MLRTYELKQSLALMRRNIFRSPLRAAFAVCAVAAVVAAGAGLEAAGRVMPSAAGRDHPFSGLSITGYSIDSAWPSSLRSVKGKATIKVQNAGERRTVTSITASVYRNGSLFAEGKCSDVTFERGVRSYTLDGTGQLSDGVSLWQAIGAVFSFRPSEYTVDVYATMTFEDGSVQRIVKTGIPATRFIRN